MIGEQQSPRFAIVHGDTDVPLVEDDTACLPEMTPKCWGITAIPREPDFYSTGTADCRKLVRLDLGNVAGVLKGSSWL